MSRGQHVLYIGLGHTAKKGKPLSHKAPKSIIRDGMVLSIHRAPDDRYEVRVTTQGQPLTIHYFDNERAAVRFAQGQ